MVLRTALWVVIVGIFFSLVLQILGYHVMEITILLILSVLILSELIRMEEREEIENVVKSHISSRLEGMEKILNFIMKNMSKMLTVDHLNELHSRVTSKIERYEVSFNERLKNEIEKLHEKILEIENKLNELKSHSSGLHKRVESIENYIFEEEEI